MVHIIDNTLLVLYCYYLRSPLGYSGVLCILLPFEDPSETPEKVFLITKEFTLVCVILVAIKYFYSKSPTRNTVRSTSK